MRLVNQLGRENGFGHRIVALTGRWAQPNHRTWVAAAHLRQSINRRKAFTLLELLVVVAIIGILAAILLPVANVVKRKSNQVTSMSNLRQWGVALVMEVSDNNGLMPYEGQASQVAVSDGDAWFNLLPPYMNEKRLSEMTTAQLPRAGQKSVWVNPAVPLSANAQFTPYLFSYSMNYYLSTAADKMMRVDRVTNRAATVFMAETGDNFANCNPKYIKAYFGAGNVDTSPDNFANFLFCDGHAQSFRRKEFDPNLGAQSINSTTLSGTLSFVPYVGAVQQ